MIRPSYRGGNVQSLVSLNFTVDSTIYGLDSTAELFHKEAIGAIRGRAQHAPARLQAIMNIEAPRAARRDRQPHADQAAACMCDVGSSCNDLL
jgi:hypothetical protein